MYGAVGERDVKNRGDRGVGSQMAHVCGGTREACIRGRGGNDSWQGRYAATASEAGSMVGGGSRPPVAGVGLEAG